MTGKILILVFGTILVLFTKLYEGCLLTYLLLPPDPVRMSEKQLLERVYRKQLTFVIDEDEYNTQGHWNIIRFSTDEKYSKFQEALSANPPFFFDGELSTLVKIFEADPTKGQIPAANCVLSRWIIQ
uniref:Uncharacterized protein n=1 Tax=Plectus sambesii TaxID=2011161 RepID=A0A914UZE2_9BILA